jgi:hypothetical protein
MLLITPEPGTPGSAITLLWRTTSPLSSSNSAVQFCTPVTEGVSV